MVTLAGIVLELDFQETLHGQLLLTQSLRDKLEKLFFELSQLSHMIYCRVNLCYNIMTNSYKINS